MKHTQHSHREQSLWILLGYLAIGGGGWRELLVYLLDTDTGAAAWTAQGASPDTRELGLRCWLRQMLSYIPSPL